MTKKAQQYNYGSSLTLAITLHAIVLSLLIFSFNRAVSHPPVMVSLLKNGQAEVKPIKAGVVDKRAIDQAIQRQALEEKQRQDRLLEQQRQAEQLQQEAEQAKKALELAKIQKFKAEEAAKLAAVEKVRLDKELALKKDQAKKIEAKKREAKQQAQKLAADKKLADKKQIADKQAADKQAADKQAQALRADRDRLQAEHNLMLQSEVDRYKAQIAAAIEDNRILSGVFTGNIICKVRISLLPDGSILSVKTIQSSGNPAYDEMSIAAVYKAAPFSMPDDHELNDQLREIVLSFKNGEHSTDA